MIAIAAHARGGSSAEILARGV